MRFNLFLGRLCFLLCFAFVTFAQDTEQIRALKGLFPVLEFLPVEKKQELAGLYFRLGLSHQEQGNFLEAVVAFRKSKALGEQANIDYYIGNAYYRLSSFERAEPFLKSFCGTVSDIRFAENCRTRLFDIYGRLGEDSLQLSLFDRAIDYYRLAEKNAPDALQKKQIQARLQHSLFQKATYYFSQKNYLEAAHFFLDVLSEGTSPKLRAQTERVANNLFLNAGKHYEKVGEPLKAQPFYEAIVRYFKPGPAYDHAEKRLDELKSVVEEVDKPPAWLVID
jgi:tetratricopeptide (TPR) repeat protein